MNREDAKRVSINNCLDDEELAGIRARIDAADAGAWRVVNGAVERYGCNPWEKLAGSLALMAASVELVPRLLRGIGALEEAVRHAWADAAGWKRECLAARTKAEEDAARRSEGKTGPEHEIALLARHAAACARLDVGRDSNRSLRPSRYETLLRRWAGGESIEGEIVCEVVRLEHDATEHEAFSAEWETKEKARVADLQRRLQDALDGIARGVIVAELEKPLREAKKRARTA